MGWEGRGGQGWEGRGGAGRGGGGAWEGMGGGGEGGRQTSREVSRGGNWPVYSIHKPSHNAALALETLVLQMKNRTRCY